MSSGKYRLIVLGCALSWFLVGYHMPALHHMLHPTDAASWSFLVVTAALVIAGMMGLRVLLRLPFTGTPGDR